MTPKPTAYTFDIARFLEDVKKRQNRLGLSSTRAAARIGVPLSTYEDYRQRGQTYKTIRLDILAAMLDFIGSKFEDYITKEGEDGYQ